MTRHLSSLALALLLPATLVAAEGDDSIQRRTANDGNVVMENVPEIPPEIVDALNRYQNTRGASFQDWRAEGDGLYVATRFADTYQIHRVDMPGGARHQLTFFQEPVYSVERRPGSSELVFPMDEGGGEFYQLHLLDPATGESRLLTDGSSRNGSAVWSEDGERLAFQSTRRDGKSNDVWIMDPEDSASAKMVLESPDGTWWGPVEWTDDGKRLLIQQYVSVSDSRVHLLDLESGERRMIAGSDETPHAALAAGFDAEDDGIFLVTTERSEFEQLAHLDLATGELEIITGEIPWDVSGGDFSEDGTRGAFVMNEGGVDRLYLLDPATREYAQVSTIPVGLIGGLEFRPDGKALAMTLNTALTPSDTFVLSLGESPLEAGELVRWTHSEVGGLDTSRFVEPELIQYPTFDEVDGKPRQIPAFVYRPRGEGPHPAIVYIHGGPESQYTPGFSSTFQMWVDVLGAAVIAPNVRGSSGYGKEYLQLDNGMRREDSVKDIGALLDWIETQPDLDQDRVAVYGGSYGGYMVLGSLMHYSDRLAAGVDVVGISNFVTFLENTEDYRRDLRRVEYGDERDPEMRKHLEAISPANHPEKLRAPLFVVQGQNDPRVPVTEAEQIVKAVRGAGYDVWYMNALNEGHGYDKKENRDLYQQAVVLFLREHLVGAAE